jgi:chromate reductase, NAD(P)H dehydrogenase (quinone)
MRVLGISGSLRHDSYNTKLLHHAGELLETEGMEFEIYEGLKDIPPYDEDDDAEDAPTAVRRIREAVREADAVFFTTPEYNSSIPGALKNALDWVSGPLAANAVRNKPVAVIGASAGMFGAVWAQAELPWGARRDGRACGRRRGRRRPRDGSVRCRRTPERTEPRGRGARGRPHAHR